MLIIYLILVYYIFFYIFLNKLKNKKFLIFLGIIPLFIALAFQEAIGTDYYSYIEIYQKIKFYPAERGILFKKILEILNKITYNERIMFITISFLQMSLFYIIILKLYTLKIIENIPLFIFITITCSHFYIQMFNILRNSIASLFVIFGVLYLLEGKKIKTFLLIFIGSLFHPSVIIWEILLFTRKIFLKKFNVLFLFFYWTSCLILKKIDFMGWMIKKIYLSNLSFTYKGYLISKNMYLTKPTLGLTVIILVISYIFSLKYYKKEKSKCNIFIYNLGYLFLGGIILVGGIPILERVLYTFYIFQTYIIYVNCKKNICKTSHYFGIIYILFGIFYYIRGIYYILPINY